jgi:two-component system chemotaxis sensor kinase CheA
VSVEEIRWNPWLDDFDRIIESMANAIKLLNADNSSNEGIENIKIELHSVKGLFDSVGFKISTQTIFELEENVHHSEDNLDASLVEMLSKALSKIKELVAIVRKDKPKPEDLNMIDKAIGFETILLKFGSEYIVEIEITGERSLRSARGLGVFNSVKRFAVIKSSTPPEEDLYLDAKFDSLILTIFSRDDLETIQKRISSLPNIANVTVEKLVKEEEQKLDDADLAQNLTIRVPLSNIRAIENGLASLSIHVEALKSEVTTTRGLEELSGIDSTFERIQGDIKKMRKVPLDSITTTFPSMVKRLSQQEGKDIDLLIQGRFVTLDRSLANHLIDPITQIIRNAISHGIEGPKQRREAKKSPTGRIAINASNDRDKIRIRITDDGIGIDKDKLLEKAKKMNLALPAKADDEEVFSLIFNKGLSMSEGSAQLSGRGIGLFSAKERISQIGGNLSVTSDPGKGTTFSIEFSDPDALSRNLIFNVNEETYAIPSSEVEQVLIVDYDKLDIETDTKASIDYEGKLLPVTILRNLIASNKEKPNLRRNTEILLVCRGRKALIGILVDSLLDERLVNIRALNPLLQNYELFNGTLAGRDREVILVVNPAAIM